MQPLQIEVSQFGTPEGIGENISYSLSLGLPELQYVPWYHNGDFVICASGPSIKNHVEDIRRDWKEGKTIVGVKGGYDFLRENGITPSLYVSVEPRYRPIKDPSKETAYLLSSRVNKQVFDELKDYPIYLWHSWSEEDYNQLLKDKFMIGGGSTSGLRAVNVGYILGYRNFTFYGMDSCLGEEGNKRVNQPPLDATVKKIDVIVGGKRFICNMAMAAQAQDFQMLYEVMPDIHISIKGGGLLSAILDERKIKGLRC